jgi:protein O-mannosyl-transferase
MPSIRDFLLHAHLRAAGIFLAALAVTWLAYSPGVGGALHFDDHHNLGGLSEVHDGASALQFITTGESGPLGRPIALASFAPQAYAWPGSPEVFLRTNIFLHLLNGALVAWVLFLLGQARGQTDRLASLSAAAGAGIWMLMPILASSTLLIVQRMTTLSAAFVLLGIIGYLYARSLSRHRPVLALSGMTMALIGGTGLAALTKENGVLLLVYVLAIESTLLTRPKGISRVVWRGWFAVMLAGPLVLLTYYLVSYLPYPESLILARDFSGFERLITQAEILWKYLYLSFLPSAAALGPFHDDYEVRRSLLQVTTLVPVTTWLVVITAAIVLRHKVPLLAFAVAWYLLGHLLESSTVPLELYFEHRNYLPLVGPAYAFVATVLSLSGQSKRIMQIALAAYSLMLAGVLFSVTSLWGSPAVAMEMWHLYKPSSQRAVLALAQELQRDGYMSASRRLLVRFVDANPESDGIRLHILAVKCLLDREGSEEDTVRSLEADLRTAKFDYGVPTTLAKLHSLINEDRCPVLERGDLLRLSQSVLENPRYWNPLVRHNIHVLIADIGAYTRDLDLAMTNLRTALHYYPNLSTLRIALSVLLSAGLRESAMELVEEAGDLRPQHPIQAAKWDGELKSLKRAVQNSM